MSHFTVGVIVEHPRDLDRVLARYNEQDEMYMERYPDRTKEEYIKWYRITHKGIELTDEEIWAIAIEEYPDDLHDDNQLYSKYNPDAHYDWYSIGGRWRYMLKVSKSAPNIKDLDAWNREPRKQRGKNRWVDGAKIKDIKWADMNRPSNGQIQHMARFWDVVVDGAEPKEGEDFGFHYKGEYYKKLYKTKDNYIMKECTFYTHDLLDGIEDEWYSMGEMGWFGVDASTQNSLDEYLSIFYETIRRPEYQDYWFIVVDCHI